MAVFKLQSGRDYPDQFSDAWKVFSNRPLINIGDWFGKRVCLKSVVFPFLARMIQGIYYNLHLVSIE